LIAKSSTESWRSYIAEDGTVENGKHERGRGGGHMEGILLPCGISAAAGNPEGLIMSRSPKQTGTCSQAELNLLYNNTMTCLFYKNKKKGGYFSGVSPRLFFWRTLRLKWRKRKRSNLPKRLVDVFATGQTGSELPFFHFWTLKKRLRDILSKNSGVLASCR